MQILRAGALYFEVVFAAGFVLGTIRTLWIIQRYGARTSELMEAPIMLVVIMVTAGGMARRQALPRSPAARLAIGFLALSFLLLTEFTVVLGIRKLTLAEYFASCDPVAGAVYLALLAIFAIMPLLVVYVRPSGC